MPSSTDRHLWHNRKGWPAIFRRFIYKLYFEKKYLKIITFDIWWLKLTPPTLCRCVPNGMSLSLVWAPNLIASAEKSRARTWSASPFFLWNASVWCPFRTTPGHPTRAQLKLSADVHVLRKPTLGFTLNRLYTCTTLHFGPKRPYWIEYNKDVYKNKMQYMYFIDIKKQFAPITSIQINNPNNK